MGIRENMGGALERSEISPPPRAAPPGSSVGAVMVVLVGGAGRWREVGRGRMFDLEEDEER